MNTDHLFPDPEPNQRTPKSGRIATFVASIALLFTVGFGLSALSASAWSTDQSATVDCQHLVTAVFRNTEPQQSQYSMDVTVHGNTKTVSGQHSDTWTFTDTATSVTFLLAWTDGHPGTDSRTVTVTPPTNCGTTTTTTKPAEHKVTLCHATDSRTNPYVQITVDFDAVIHEGHGSHVGPVFSPDLPKHTKWGDIIPPFDFGGDAVFGGLNWDAVGQAVYGAGCELPVVVTTTVPQTTTTLPTTTSTVPQTTTTTAPTTTATSTTVPTTTTTIVQTTTTTTPVTTTPTTAPPTTVGSTVPQTVPTTVTSSTVPETVPPVVTTPPAPRKPLPTTGSNTSSLILLAIFLIVVGYGLYMWSIYKNPDKRGWLK